MSDHLLDGRLKLRHLNLVTTIAEEGSIVAAAAALHVTQPVVTRGLRELEEIVGVALFDRGPRGVAPTVYGESFLEHARAVLAQLRRAGDQIQLLSRADLGTVTVGIHLAGSNLLLPRAIAALKDEHPGLTVVVREATPDVLQTALLSGECDLVVGRLSARVPRGLTQELLYREPVRLVARAGHPVHRMRSPGLERLMSFPWILPVEQTALRAELENLLARAGLGLPENRIECTSMPTLRELLLSTDCLAAVPMSIAGNDERLELIATPLSSIRQAVGLTWATDRPASAGANALHDRLRAESARLDVRASSISRDR
ncbi:MULTISPECIES: LysR substrate-binding domain-containing protein [unclassified Nocardioides]|uniref:LysR substrate-binding domain-containing protein n=1 Tax=unclassified Nocardioides TaxID=2615069 RepID=UPI00361C9C72